MFSRIKLLQNGVLLGRESVSSTWTSFGSTMIHSLFLINSSGDIFLEKHWKSVVSRSVCDYFFEAQERATEAENVPPVIPTPHHYLLNVYRHKIFFVAVIQTEVPPLFVIEFLHRVVDTFQVRKAGYFVIMFRIYLSLVHTPSYNNSKDRPTAILCFSAGTAIMSFFAAVPFLCMACCAWLV